MAAKFLAEVVTMARGAKLMSDDHFTVDGTLIEAWAGVKSFRPKGEDPTDRKPPDDPGNPTVNFHGETGRKTRFKGRVRTQLAAHLVAAAYNLLRIAKLTAAPA